LNDDLIKDGDIENFFYGGYERHPITSPSIGKDAKGYEQSIAYARLSIENTSIGSTQQRKV